MQIRNWPWPIICMSIGLVMACLGILLAHLPTSPLYIWGWAIVGVGGIVFSYSMLWIFARYK